MCAPVSQITPDSSLGEFLMIQTTGNLPGDTVGLPFFLRDSSFHRSRVCVPLSLRQDLIHQKVNLLMIQICLPGNTISLSLLKVRQAGSYHLQLHPSLGRCGVSLVGCCIYKFHKLSVLWLLLFIGTF